ncbi:MAG: shikimate kinase [Alphaproteobacteria bacterium]|nr:shikimate kinase [Alphaproteobacteria bacterium]
MRDDPVFIGPPNVGKSTVSRLVAEALGRPYVALDPLRRAYFEELGFDMALNLRLYESEGWGSMFQYWQVFQPHALERFFAEHSGVLDLGGGMPIGENPWVRQRIRAAFAPFRHVVLLLPDPDPDIAMRILGTRSPDDEALRISQRYFMEEGSFQAVATQTVYTGARSADSVCDEVLAHL